MAFLEKEMKILLGRAHCMLSFFYLTHTRDIYILAHYQAHVNTPK